MITKFTITITLERIEGGVKYDSMLTTPSSEELKGACERNDVDPSLLQFFFSWSDAMRAWEKWMAANHPKPPS